MQKKVKDLTQKEWDKICSSYKMCNSCPLFDTCLFDLSVTTLEDKKKFYNAMDQMVEVKKDGKKKNK